MDILKKLIMKKTSATIVFFGSGPVAAKSLELLCRHFTIEAVVTKPRAAHHKGAVPVLEIVERYNLPVKTVTNKASLDKLVNEKPFKSQLAILIDFGIIVSQKAIDYFPLGIINSHFSLLPEWRGADPITFSILSGQSRTGVSLMLLTAGMDEGPILGYGVCDIDSSTTTPKLTEDLIELSDALLTTIVPKYILGEIAPQPQPNHIEPTYSRKLSKDDADIDWHKPAQQIEREVRAFIEWPKSRTTIKDIDFIVTAAHVVDQQGKPGDFDIQGKQLIIFADKQALAIDKLKPVNKQEMSVAAFLAGYGHALKQP